MAGSHHWCAELYRLMGLPGKEDGENFSEYELKACEADWDAAARRLESHPHEASVAVQVGWGVAYSPLVTALCNEERPVPPHIVEGMIKACPKSIEEDIRDPLVLIAALYNPNTTVEVWKILLAHVRSSVISDLQSVHVLLFNRGLQGARGIELLKMFLEVAPRALHNRDDGDELPIETALTSAAPKEIIRFLLEEGTKQRVGGRHGAGGLLANSGSGEEDTVLQVVVEQYMHNMTNERRDILLDCFRSAGAALAELDSMKYYPPIHGAIQFAPLEVAIDLIENRVQDFHTVIDPSGRSALDIALIVAERAMSSGRVYAKFLEDSTKWRLFLGQYLTKRDGGAAARRRDVAGRLPLHVAIEKRLCIQHGLELIADAYPHAAACYNTHGEIPLHVAVKKGKLTRQSGLECIMAACPRAAICRDAKTGMYPFMLAGCAPDSNIDTVFMMLREDPTAVHGGIRPSARELYLMKTQEKERSKFAEERLEWQKKEAEWKKKEAEMKREIALLKTERLGPTDGEVGSGRKRGREY